MLRTLVSEPPRPFEVSPRLAISAQFRERNGSGEPMMPRGGNPRQMQCVRTVAREAPAPFREACEESRSVRFDGHRGRDASRVGLQQGGEITFQPPRLRIPRVEFSGALDLVERETVASQCEEVLGELDVAHGLPGREEERSSVTADRLLRPAQFTIRESEAAPCGRIAGGGLDPPLVPSRSASVIIAEFEVARPRGTREGGRSRASNPSKGFLRFAVAVECRQGQGEKGPNSARFSLATEVRLGPFLHAGPVLAVIRPEDPLVLPVTRGHAGNVRSASTRTVRAAAGPTCRPGSGGRSGTRAG